MQITDIVAQEEAFPSVQIHRELNLPSY